MARHLALLGGSPSLVAALRFMLHPDDRVIELPLRESRPWELADVDAVMVDLPVRWRRSAVERIRARYSGRLVVMVDPTDDHAALVAEHDCLVIERPIDIAHVLALVTFGPSGRAISRSSPDAARHGGRAASRAREAVPPHPAVTRTRFIRPFPEPIGKAPAAAVALGSAAAAASESPAARAVTSDAAAGVLGPPGQMVLGGMSLLGAYLAVVAVSELAWRPLGVSVLASAACHGLLALLLCLGQRAGIDARTAALLPPLIAISVVRLITFAALPSAVRPVMRLVVVGGPALVAAALAGRLRSPEWSLLRPRRGGWPGQIMVALLGVPLAVLAWALAPPTVRVGAGTPTLVAATVLVVFAALPDELLYRGLLVPAGVGVAGGWGLPLSSLAYALAYLPGGSTRTVVLAFLVGTVLGWCRQWTGSVVGVVAAHGLLNILLYLVLRVSGS
jgi:membrane protease YdiL (CAAX protease family)